VKRNLRRLLIGLLSVLALAGLAVALSLTPTVQTLVAQSILARQPGLRSSLGSVSGASARPMSMTFGYSTTVRCWWSRR
jgi:hypothetical protein